jgi:hypothetical protein
MQDKISDAVLKKSDQAAIIAGLEQIRRDEWCDTHKEAVAFRHEKLLEYLSVGYRHAIDAGDTNGAASFKVLYTQFSALDKNKSNETQKWEHEAIKMFALDVLKH